MNHLADSTGLFRFKAWRLQREIPPGYVMPGACLEADLFINPDVFKSESPVELYARRIRESDTCVCLVEALNPQNLEQRGVERRSDALATATTGNVHGNVHCPPIRGALPVRARVSVAEDVSPVLANEPGKPLCDVQDPSFHLRNRRPFCLKRDRRRFTKGTIDLEYGCGVYRCR